MPDEENIEGFYEDLENENKQLKSKVTEYQAHISNTSFNREDGGNIIQWIAETDDILDKIEHFLKGDVVKTDEQGNVSFVEQTDEDLIILNEYGVNSIMQILGNYINRNVILSFYELERVYEILGDIGDELATFILCNYEKMGMTTEFKKARYILMVLQVLHIIESSFRRALGGKAMEEINTGRTVIQSENIGMMRNPQMPKKRFNPFKRSTW